MKILPFRNFMGPALLSSMLDGTGLDLRNPRGISTLPPGITAKERRKRRKKRKKADASRRRNRLNK